MSELLTEEEIVAGLVRQGVPRTAAVRAARHQTHALDEERVKRAYQRKTPAIRRAKNGDYASRTSPRQLEHEIQVALFDLVRAHEERIPQLKHYFAIPNGGHRAISVAVRLKREGVRAGVVDTFWALQRKNPDGGIFSGLWIELKRPGGRVTPEQSQWLTDMTFGGYKTALHHTTDGAFQELLDYWALGE